MSRNGLTVPCACLSGGRPAKNVVVVMGTVAVVMDTVAVVMDTVAVVMDVVMSTARG